MEMNQTEAIGALRKALSEIENLQKNSAFSSEHTRWLLDTTNILEEIFGRGSRIYRNFVSIEWRFRGAFVADPWEFETTLEKRNQQAFLQALEMARGILEAGIDLIKRKGIENVFASKESNEIVKIISLIDGKLRKLVRAKPEKEKDITDALENLFIGAGLDKEFLREKIRIPYSTKTYIPDFVFERISTTVEDKLCDSEEREKELIAEINDDILAYRTKYRNLIFVVYDLGVIRDQDQFKESIEAQDNVILLIIKH